MTKIARSGSGSISQRYGSPDPDPHQNVMDPEHWFKVIKIYRFHRIRYFSSSFWSECILLFLWWYHYIVFKRKRGTEKVTDLTILFVIEKTLSHAVCRNLEREKLRIIAKKKIKQKQSGYDTIGLKPICCLKNINLSLNKIWLFQLPTPCGKCFFVYISVCFT